MTLPLNYPEEYIDGKVTFFGRDFVVTPDVLIPRLETEGLVRRARQVLQTKQDNSNISGFGGGNLSKNSSTKNNTQEEFSSSESEQNIAQQSEDGASFSSPDSFTPQGGTGGTIFATKNTGNGVEKRSTGFLPPQAGQKQRKTIVVDIGCGSGIIGTSVADLADEVIFLDISEQALHIAEKNFRSHFPDKKAQFIISDLLSNIPTLQHSNILFVTNLPYIRDEDWQHMSADTVYEPKLALFGGEKTGFELYERLFEQFDALAQLPTLQHSNTPTLLYEFGFDQREVAEAVIKKYPQWEYSFFADYAGVERFGEIILIQEHIR